MVSVDVKHFALLDRQIDRNRKWEGKMEGKRDGSVG